MEIRASSIYYGLGSKWRSPKKMDVCRYMMIYEDICITMYEYTICGTFHIPVVPHKAVAEVSKIGNL